MKAIITLSVVVLFAAALTNAADQSPLLTPVASISSLSFSVVEVGSMKSTQHNWETDYGSYDRDKVRSKKLKVEVRNLSRLPAPPVKIEVYWLNYDYSEKRFYAKRQILTQDIPAGQARAVEAAAPTTVENDTNYAALGYRTRAGTKSEGYVVLVRAGEKIVGAKASESVQSFGREPEKLAALETKDF